MSIVHVLSYLPLFTEFVVGTGMGRWDVGEGMSS